MHEILVICQIRPSAARGKFAAELAPPAGQVLAPAATVAGHKWAPFYALP